MGRHPTALIAGLTTTVLAGAGTAAFLIVPALHRRSHGRRSVSALASADEPTGVPRLGAPQSGSSVNPSKYYKARREGLVEELHGVKVADPYRWLEDPDSKETQKFVAAQNKLTNEVLKTCDTREKFKEVFTAAYDYPKYGTPFKRGERYFYYYNSGLQQHYTLFTQSSLKGEATVLLDPNTFSKDGTVALSGLSFSEDGNLLAYSRSSGGSDWVKIHVLAIGADGKPEERSDVLEFVKFSSMAWTHDHKGFFYNRYETGAKLGGTDLGTETDTNVDQLLYYHVLGTPQSEDPLIYATPDHPLYMIGAGITDDGRYLMMSLSEGCQPVNKLYYVDLEPLKRTADGAIDFKAYDFKTGTTPLPVMKLVDNFDASYDVVANDGTKVYFMTNLNAKRYRIVTTTLGDGTSPDTWEDLVPEHPKDLLQSVSVVANDKMVLSYLRDVKASLQIASLTTGKLLQHVPLPGVGSVGTVNCERKQDEIFFSFTSFVEPGAQYRIDTNTEDLAPVLFRRTELKVAHDPADYVTEQKFATSKDGVKIPMFITHRVGLKLDGSNPTLLYGYGGFNISLEPTFSVSRMCWMKYYNGVYVQANLRGGGEYGIAWRDGGSNDKKQNVMNDLQACAEFLHKEGYSSPATTAIQGGSNGGLVVAACANQRPDLFACVLAQVGVMDMLRFHKFTIGHAWQTDFGSPDKADEFAYILPYSPLHNVKTPNAGTKQYPAMLLSTGDHDDRVVPLHSYKLIAELQHELALRHKGTSAQLNSLLIRIEVRAGHGAGKPTAKVIEETSDSYAFMAKCLNAHWVA